MKGCELRMKKLTKKAGKVGLKKVFMLALCLCMCFAMAVPCFAAEEGVTSLAFNFEAAEMFSWANMMLNAMMPVVYITLGISLAFIIIAALKSAFSR